MKLYYGAAYYPELWRDTVDEDMALMRRAGINIVRIGEFAWSSMERDEGAFCFDLFAQVIEKLHKAGIDTVICTPTATPPVWLSDGHPERMIVDGGRNVMAHGGRQQMCTNNAVFHQHADRIIEEMAKALGSLPGVVAWQLDNEIKGNVSECYCECCKALWHPWLMERFGTVEALNDAWGTHTWSQHYQGFEQVPQPFATPMTHNPSLVTAYRLFSRDFAARFLRRQADIIRKYSSLPITHNANFNHFIDNEKTYEPLDFAGLDHYSASDEYNKFLTHLDMYKTIKPSPFWVMETAATFSGYSFGYIPIHKNNYICAELAAAYASGAQGFLYWLWRQHRSGVEQTHGHIISAWGEPGVGFENVRRAGELRTKLEKALNHTRPAQAEIAATYSDTARAFFLTEPLEGIDYTAEMMNWHERIQKLGLNGDFILEHASLDGYKLLCTPFFPYMSDAYLEKAKAFTEAGGIWIVGPIAATRTEHQTIHTDHALGKLEAFAGVNVLFHYPVTGSGARGEAFGVSADLSYWSTILACGDAAPVGFTTSGVTPNMPFVSECKRGKGKVVILGSMPCGENGDKFLECLILHYAKEANAQLFDITNGTIVIPREGEKKQWVVINMDGNGGKVYLPQGGLDLIGGKVKEPGYNDVLPYETMVVEFHR